MRMPLGVHCMESTAKWLASGLESRGTVDPVGVRFFYSPRVTASRRHSIREASDGYAKASQRHSICERVGYAKASRRHGIREKRQTSASGGTADTPDLKSGA